MNLDMKRQQEIMAWTAGRAFDGTEVDCFTCVMLKILDGKCKMSESGKLVMELLYDQVKTLSGMLLGEAEHAFIAEARACELDDATRMRIYERRLLAETMISRPVMKAFKASLREAGIIGGGV